jgi:sugar/nucleoside kinase (ribokinase family)
MQMIRTHLPVPIYCDLHMLMWAVQSDGRRSLRVLPDIASWCGCFDILQMNEEEMSMLAPDSLALSATAMAAGTSCLCVTLGRQGVVYVAAPGFEWLDDRPERGGLATGSRGGAGNFGAVRTALVPAALANVEGDGDPTGCGDVWGATYFSRLLAGDMLTDAIIAANRAAARNVEHRGASGLAQHLRGELSTT